VNEPFRDREAQRAAIAHAGQQYYYTPQQEFDDRNKKMVIAEMVPHIKPGRILELGYTNTIWTDALLPHADALDIVEAAPNHVAQARGDFAADRRVTVYDSLFEEFTPPAPYDTIVMSGVIKHLPDDVGFVSKTRGWLKPDGVVIGTTPNSRSFHRRLGAYMGLESRPDAPNRRDVEVMNLHLYDRFSWRSLFVSAGYDVTVLRGIFLKILSTDQMMHLGERYDVDRVMEGLRQLAEELQDYAWYLLLVGRPAAER
jgi:SAM-dependent methyltransferase